MKTSPNASFGWLISKSARMVVRMYQKEMAHLGVTPPQSGILLVLSQHGPMTQTAIGDLLLLEKANLSEMIRRLRDAKLIETDNSPDDARSVVHTLNPKGEAIANEVLKIDGIMDKELKALVSVESAKGARELLMAILDLSHKP